MSFHTARASLKVIEVDTDPQLDRRAIRRWLLLILGVVAATVALLCVALR